MKLRGRAAAAAVAVTAAALPVALGAQGATAGAPVAKIKHVVVISVDGMHQSDLTWFDQHYPHSALAMLTRSSREYTNALTSNPSDSDPGGSAIMTGADPGVMGVYYDVEYSHLTDEPALIGGQPSGGAACTPGKPATGGDVIYDSPDDKLPAVADLLNNNSGNTFPSFDEGGSIYPNGVDRDPAKIMDLTPHPQSGLNAGNFPVNPKNCKPIMPWDYLKVNTIFQVIHEAGLRTAWSDKHAIYASFNGPGSNGMSIDDFFAPEIDSQAVMPNGVPYPSDTDWAHDDAATKQYDSYKVQAVINEINGYNHTGHGRKVGTPAVLGMNFQAVSVAEKLDSSANLTCVQDKCTESPVEPGGYYPGGTTPRPLLAGALTYVSAQLGRMVVALREDHLASSTAIIITAKHGQSPTDPNLLRRIKDGPIIDAINAAWAQTHPSNTKLIVAGTDDDLWQSYLSDRSQSAADFVVNYLMSHTAQAEPYGTNNDGTAPKVTVPHSGVSQCFAGAAAAKFFGVSTNEGRHPDVFCRVQVGVVYTGGSKIAEHGGMNPDDRHVLMLVWAPGIVRHGTVRSLVSTKQVAPTVLRLLGLDPRALRAVRIEGTKVLPGIS